MTTQVNIDPARSHAVFNEWGNLDKYKRADGKPSPVIGMVGHDLLDGAAYALLKAEFLAAQAGAVPWIPLPGGGQGVMTIGGALGQPINRWSQPELAHLYMLNHKSVAALHSNVRAARATTPLLDPATEPMPAEFLPAGQYQIGLPVAWIVVAAVGILATMAGAYYATRTAQTRIQTEANLAADTYKTGQLTNLAQQQLLSQGRIDPKLIAAIRDAGSATGFSVWPWVTVGAGAVLAAGTGTYIYTQHHKRR